MAQTKPKAEPIDMSPDAIDRRLQEVRSLNRLCRYLGQFRMIGPGELHASKREPR